MPDTSVDKIQLMPRSGYVSVLRPGPWLGNAMEAKMRVEREMAVQSDLPDKPG